jgi:tetratricopeptide (TPR) repeat protein
MEASFEEALRLAASADDPAGDAWIRLARGSTHAQLGEWSAAERWLRDARARCAALGDRTRWWNVTSGLAHVLAYRGELADAETLLREAIEVNRDTDNPLFLCWGLAGHADLLHRLGHGGEQSEVLRSLRRAREALAQRPDAAADLFSRGVLAAALWRAGHGDEAWELTRETVDQTLHRAPMVWLQISSYLGLALVLDQCAREAARRDEAQRLLVRVERSLRGFARLIPIARPALALVRGDCAMAHGHAAQAQKHYASALAQAEAAGQPLEGGKALLAMAGTGSGAQAALALDRAAVIFERIGARWHLEHARGRRNALPEANIESLESDAVE